MSSCIYAGSFDPFHYGHQHIVKRAAKAFNEVYVVVANNPKKKHLLSVRERMECATSLLATVPKARVIELPEGRLVTDLAKGLGVQHIVKGIRNLQDTEYEKMLHEVTLSLEDDIETVVYFSPPNDQKISSGAVKDLISFNADVQQYVDVPTKALVELRQNKQLIVGLTGVIGAGKSHIAKLLRDDNGLSCSIFDKEHSLGDVIPNQLHHVDLDVVSSMITFSVHPEWSNAETQQVRGLLSDYTKEPLRVMDKTGTMVPNRVGIAKKLFEDPSLNAQVQELYKPAMLRAIRKMISGRQGIILIDGALLIDLDLTYLCNHHVIVAHADAETVEARLMDRYDGNKAEVATRVKAQLSHNEKVERFYWASTDIDYGNLVAVDNSETDPLGIASSRVEQQSILRQQLWPLFKEYARL